LAIESQIQTDIFGSIHPAIFLEEIRIVSPKSESQRNDLHGFASSGPVAESNKNGR
jgi:hypothetical protein